MAAAAVTDGRQAQSLSTVAWWVLGYNIVVVLWGALVRATGSGAGCGEHWPLCNGSVVPAFPQYKTVIEFTHRLTSGLAFLSVAWLVWRMRKVLPAMHLARRAGRWALVLMVNETLIGAALVRFGLVAGSQSPWRAVVLTIHLANTMLLLGSIALMAHWSNEVAPRWRAEGKVRTLFFIAVGLALLTAAFGGIAALGDTLFPASSVSAGVQQEFAKDAHWIVRLRVFHPVIAIVTGLYFLYMVMTVPVGGTVRVIAGLTISQFALGALNIVLLTPLWTQLAHLLLTDLLWVSLVLYGAELPAQLKKT